MNNNNPGDYRQSRPPVLIPVDDASKDDWTFTVNPEWHHRYPDIKGYRRDSNNITPGDAEYWNIDVRVSRFGLAQLRIDYPPQGDIFSGEADGIWACPHAKAVGFINHVSIVDDNACRFIEPDGGRSRSTIARHVLCPTPEGGTIIELSCPGLEEGAWVSLVLRREVVWRFPSGFNFVHDWRSRRGDMLQHVPTPPNFRRFIVYEIFDDDSFTVQTRGH
jgi:hypothetical protein